VSVTNALEGQSDEAVPSVLKQLTTETELFKAGEVGSSKKILVSTLLRDLFTDGHLSGGAAFTSTMLSYIPRENKHFYKAAMALVEEVLMDEQRALLRTSRKDIPLVDAAHLEQTLMSIDEACKEKMADREGKKVGKTTATMTGLGARYIAWKKKQQPKPQGSLLTSFVTRIVEAVSPSKKKK